jgi:lipopolysaccharide assembly outer membrane protein LptD (OstA)
MTNLLRAAPFAVTALLLVPAAAVAQQIPGFDTTLANTQEFLSQDHFRLTGEVVLVQSDMTLYADAVDYYPQTNRLVAIGNVLLKAVDHQIAADRADFNAVTRLGTFYNARGFAALGTRVDISQFGTLQPDVQFYGETIEKIGPDTYLISDGGFTTCAQANPRWEMTSGSIRLRLDHYALLRNMLLKAKGVPVLFLPVLYYPISKDSRQTGFLMPTYGSSTLKGQTISNGFFWAMSRSRDMTFLHDFYSKTGQAVSGEYRYLDLRGSGNLQINFIDNHPATYVTNGASNTVPGARSYQLIGNMSQGLGGGWYAQARANYFSSIQVQQTYSSNIDQTSQRNRLLGGSLSGSLAGYRLTATYDRNEAFTGTASSSVRGSAPRLNVARPDRLISHTPIYAGVTTEYVHLVVQSRTDGATPPVTTANISRLDVQPIIRFPFTRLPFLSLNTSLMWRNTFWSDSLTPQPDGSYLRAGSPISRHFYEMTANANGPTFVRIWDAGTRRFKHSIEPFLQITHRTAIDNAKQIVQFEYVDSLVGNMTQYAYGASTHLYMKPSDAGPRTVAREIIGATVQQTYYTDANAILSDQQYRTTNATAPVSHFSPVSLLVRASPKTGVDATFNTEFDGRYSRFRTMSANGAWRSQRLNLTVGWTHVLFSPDALGNNIPAALSHSLNTNTTVRFHQNRFGIIHSFNYDVHNRDILQQRIAGYYNAQCCGFTAEYQTFDFSHLGTTVGVPKDHRFHFSITLAGIGNVSNIFGALGGTPNR